MGAGIAKDNIPIVGGTLLVDVQVVAPHFLGGVPDAAGDGSIDFTLDIPPDESLIGRHFYFQAGYLDDQAVLGVSLTNGLDVTIG